MFKSAKKFFVTSLTFVFLMSSFSAAAFAAQDMKNMSASEHKKMTPAAKKVVKKPAAKKPVKAAKKK